MRSCRRPLPLTCLTPLFAVALLASCGGDDAASPHARAIAASDGGPTVTAGDGGTGAPGSDGGTSGVHGLPTTNQIGAVRLYQPVLYTSPGTVHSLHEVPGASLVVSEIDYPQEGSWKIVVQAPDGTNASTLASSAMYPHTEVQQLQVGRSAIVLVLGDLELGSSPEVVVPLAGAAPFTLEPNIYLLQLSEDGTRINYVVGDGKNPWQVKTLLLSSAVPVTLGTVPVTESFIGVNLFTATSFISNVPEVGLTLSTGVSIYRVGQAPQQVSTTASASVTFVGGFTGSETAYLPSGELYDLTGNRSLGTLSSVSPDGHSASIQGSTFTILHDTGAPTTATLTKGLGNVQATWSADSSHVVLYASATESWDVIDAAKGTVQHGSYTKPNATFLAPSSAGDHLFFTRDNGTSPATLSLDSVAADGSGAFTFSTAVATNFQKSIFAPGIVFKEGVGIYAAQASGAGRVRLDPPRASENFLSSDYAEELNRETWVFDPATQRVVINDIVSAVDLISDFDTPLALLSTTITDAAADLVLFPPNSKVTGQVRAVTPVMPVTTTVPPSGQLLLQSVDGSRGNSSERASLAIGDLQGNPLRRLSPTDDDDAGVPFGEGVSTFDNEPAPVSVAGQAAVIFTYRPTPTEANVLVEANDGGVLATWSGETFRQVSRDGTLAALTDPTSDQLGVGRLAPGGTVTPIFPSLAVEGTDGCYGCRAANVQFNVDDQIAFDALGRLVFNTSAGVQLGNADGTGLVSLGGDSMYVSTDGTRAFLPSSTTGDIVAETLAATPSGQAVAHMATYFGSSADGGWLLYDDGTSIHAVNFDGTGDRLVVAATSNDLNGFAQSPDGQSWVVGVGSRSNPADPSCQASLLGFSIASGAVHTVASLPSCLSYVANLSLSADGSQVTYSYASGLGLAGAFTMPFAGGTPTALAPAGEVPVVFATSPTSHRTLIESVKADGSHDFAVVDPTTGARTLFGPSGGNSRVTQFLFLDDTHALLIADFDQPGELDLYELTLP